MAPLRAGAPRAASAGPDPRARGLRWGAPPRGGGAPKARPLPQIAAEAEARAEALPPAPL